MVRSEEGADGLIAILKGDDGRNMADWNIDLVREFMSHVSARTGMEIEFGFQRV